MEMFIFLLMNLAAGISAFLLAYRVLKVNDALAFFLLYYAQIILTQIFLGLFGMLTLENLILLNFAVLVFVFLFAKRNLYLAGIGESAEEERLWPARFVFLLFSLFVGFVAVKILVNLVNPPFGWDNLNYHFTFPVEWLKHADLANPMVVSDDPCPAYYPINGSLIFLWYIFPFKSAFIADIAQLPFFIISFLALRKIGKKIGLPDESALLAAFVFVFIPNFFKQLQIAYVDIIVAGLFLTGVYFLILIKEMSSLKNVFFFCLALGLFIGTKSIAFIYSAFLVVPFFCIVLAEKGRKLRARVGYLVLALAVVSACGGFSYIRNLILTGNPFYPLEVSLWGKTVFPGVIDKATLAARHTARDYSLAKLLFSEGLGVQSLLLILPGAVCAFLFNIIRRKSRDIFLNYLLLLPLLLFLAFRFFIWLPNTRYLYSMLGVGVLVSFWLMDSLKFGPKAIRIISFICIFAGLFEIARKYELGFSFGLSALVFIFILIMVKSRALKRILASSLLICVGFSVLVFILQILSLDYKNFEYVRYVKNSRFWPDATKAWLWLNENSNGNNIAYVGRPVPYPLYGTDYKNNVYYVSVNTIDPICLHDLKGSRYRWTSDAATMHENFAKPYNYRGKADYATWFSNLKRRKTMYLFVYSLHHTKEIVFPVEEDWAVSHPAEFIPVFGNETVRIYRLKNS